MKTKNDLSTLDNQITENSAKTSEDNQILELVLTRDYGDGGFTVINPQTSTGMGDFDEHVGEQILNDLQKSEVPFEVLTKLLNMFIRKNKETVTLTLESKPEKGYLVDYDGKFSKYFDKEGGGWERWHKENPKARCNTWVSLPAYDKEHDLILIYIGKQCHWLAGSGDIILFKNTNGKLQEIGRSMQWIS